MEEVTGHGQRQNYGALGSPSSNKVEQCSQAGCTGLGESHASQTSSFALLGTKQSCGSFTQVAAAAHLEAAQFCRFRLAFMDI